MEKSTGNTSTLAIGSGDVLTEILRQGAQRMLAAVQNEVEEYITAHLHRLTLGP